MKLIIDRKRWLRGGGNDSCLLDGEGRMCCLGFYGIALGFSGEEILEKPEPNNLNESDGFIDRRWPEWLVDRRRYNTKDCVLLMRTNDNKDLSDGEREDQIREIFMRNGIEVSYV